MWKCYHLSITLIRLISYYPFNNMHFNKAKLIIFFYFTSVFIKMYNASFLNLQDYCLLQYS